MRFSYSRLTRLLTVAAAVAGLAVSLAASASAANLPGKGKPTFVLGDKNFPEENILGSLYQEALQAKGYKVTLKGNLGSTEIAWKALKAGQIQGYPEYDGTLLATIAGISKNAANAKAEATETKTWLAKHGYVFTNTTPFTDSDAIAVLKSYANAHGLKTIGDLKKLGAAVKLGGAPEFSTRYPDGLLGLHRIYKVFPTFTPLNIPSFYTALDSKQVQAAAVFTTDPPLKTGKYTVLKDTKFIFGFQNVGMVVKKSVATREGSAFTSTINAVSRLLTQSTIIDLNSAVEVNKEQPAAVAHAFLKANHLL
ncbi:MAG TPA: glycine betaine ABC transporter substrate-binding protein [Solirubrobacteraceae bacterium]|nr:glycine betaine ABC transporter substrate-binding protein [Solirubrobacteraceae bacterium]